LGVDMARIRWVVLRPAPKIRLRPQRCLPPHGKICHPFGARTGSDAPHKATPG
jgi:hypothetical protein